MNKFATLSTSRNVTLSRNKNVIQDSKEFVKLPNQVMEGVQALEVLEDRDLEVLEVDMGLPLLLSVEMFPSKNVAAFQDKNAEMSHNKSAEVFQDNNARMYPVNNAQLFLVKFSVRSAQTSHSVSVLMFQWKNARMFPSRCHEVFARTFLLKNALLLPEKSARVFPRSSVNQLVATLVKMFQELSAETFQPRLAKMFPEKFPEMSAKHERLRNATLLRTKTAKRSPRSSARLSLLKSVTLCPKNSVAMFQLQPVRTPQDKFQGKSARVSLLINVLFSLTWSVPMLISSFATLYLRRTAEANQSSNAELFQDSNVGKFQDNNVRRLCQVMAMVNRLTQLCQI